MTCQRCHGLMANERICDVTGASGDGCVEGYRCILCGNLVDTVILQNRQQFAALNVIKQAAPRLP